MNNVYLEKELRKLAYDLSRAERTCDVERLNQLIADDYLGIGDTGVFFDKAMALQRFRDPELRFDMHELGEIKCRVYNYVGVVTGTVELRGKYAGSDFVGLFAFTDVWVQCDNDWHVVSSQMTAVDKPD